MTKAPPAPVESLRPIKHIAPKVVIRCDYDTTFYHSGDLGDIIYSLPFVKSVGGGCLYVGPDSKWDTYSKTDQQRYRFLLPLLRAQPYLKRADFSFKLPSWTKYNLNLFREVWFDHPLRARNGVSQLFEAYPVRFGTDKINESEPWLTVTDPIIFADCPVVIHRSERYRNDRFPWRDVAQRYAYRMIFVGLKSEYDEWISTYGNVARFHQVKDGLELARVIAGAKLFIGNQSCPNSIALGLGVPVIQESAPGSADCRFSRKNAQYFERPTDKIKWPSFGPRYVIPVPDVKGVFDLGPCSGAYGIGDSLTLTPLIQALNGNAILRLPLSMAHIAPLFADLCPVLFTEDFPVFKHESNAQTWHMAESKLRMFGKWPASIEPTIKITEKEQAWAKEQLRGISNPIAFVPTCKPEWAYIRQQPPEFWKDYVELLSTRFTVLQFGLMDYPSVSKRMAGYTIREIAALYSQIGRYIGVDTGDVHMMLGVGGTVTVFNPPTQPKHVPAEWEYRDCPRATYADPRNQQACDDAVMALLS